MQTISNQTRAYLRNADGLRGFLVEQQKCDNIVKILLDALNDGQIEYAKKWHMVDTTIFKMVDDYLNLLNLEDEEKKKKLQAMSEEERYKLQ